jgi:hypothetical protein
MLVRNGSDGRRGLWRSRWAAIGAAVAVTLGGGGLFVANAASSVPSSVVTITPVRKLDTRTGLGLSGPFQSMVPRKLTITGGPVPIGATGVLLNVTVVAPSARGFLSVRPGNATGMPSTSSLNFEAGDVLPNSVQVSLPTSGPNRGQIDITYDAYGVPGHTTHVLADIVGYLAPAGGGSVGVKTVLLETGAIGVAPFDYVTGVIECPPGSVPIGTGFRAAGDLNFVKIYGTFFMGYFLENSHGFVVEVEAQVVCMSGLTSAALTAELTDPAAAEEEFRRDVERLKQQHAEETNLLLDD